MPTNRFFQFTVILAVLNIFPMALFAQEDVSVEFFFKKPNKYICEIRNMTESRMIIRFGDMESLSLSAARFDIVRNINDTIRGVFYDMKVESPHYIHLDPGQIYTTSYKDNHGWRFIKSKIYVEYTVETSMPKRGTFEKIFNLTELRNKAYIPQAVREQEK
jgi:hypothetical protein